MKKILILSFLILTFFAGCELNTELSTIFEKNELPFSENSTFSKNGRFFVAAGTQVVEIIKDGNNDIQKTVIVDTQNPAWQFTGLTSYQNKLYAASTFMVYDNVNPLPTPVACNLYQIDVSNDTPVIKSTLLPDHFVILANGMATDSKGNIYISNTYGPSVQAFGLPEAAILKIEVIDEENFTVKQTNWLYEETIGGLPNGLQIKGNRAYLASNNVILKIAINDDGSAGTPAIIYQTDVIENIIDDFTIFGKKIILCELDNPFDAVVTGKSQLTVISTAKRNEGDTLTAIELADYGILPSSVSVSPLKSYKLFKPFSLLITDWVNGGLFQVSFQ